MYRKSMAITSVLVLLAVASLIGYQYFPIRREGQKVVELEIVALQWRYSPKILNSTDSRANATAISTYDSFANTRIVVSKGDLVVIHLSTGDVPHGFAIEGYPNVGPYEVVPGEGITFSFTADHAGSFTFYCTVFCGPGHPNHKGMLIVLA